MEAAMRDKRRRTKALDSPLGSEPPTPEEMKEQAMFKQQLAMVNNATITTGVDRIVHLQKLLQVMKPVVRSLASTVNGAMNAHPGDDAGDSEGPKPNCKKYSPETPDTRHQKTGVGLHGKPGEAEDSPMADDSIERRQMTRMAARALQEQQKDNDDKITANDNRKEQMLSNAEKRVDKAAITLNNSMTSGIAGLQDALDSLQGRVKDRHEDQRQLEMQLEDTKKVVAEMHSTELVRQQALWDNIDALKGAIMQLANGSKANQTTIDDAKGVGTTDYAM